LIFDKSIESFYDFFRYIVGLSLLNLIIFGTLLGFYLYLEWDIKTDICATYIPCFLLYSRFPSGYTLYYLFTIIGFILIIFFTIIYMWLKFDKKMHWEEVNGDNSMVVSKIFFNSWDWSIDTQHEMQEM